MAAFCHLLALESLQAVGGELGRAAARVGARMQTAALSACVITQDLRRDRKHLGQMGQMRAGLKCQSYNPHLALCTPFQTREQVVT